MDTNDLLKQVAFIKEIDKLSTFSAGPDYSKATGMKMMPNIAGTWR